jgi:hypothetical protein
MTHRLILLLALCGLPVIAAAQSTTTIAWDHPNAPAVVATYTHAVLVDGVAQTGTTTCAASPGIPGQTTCRMIVPALASGAHTITIRATLGGNTAEGVLVGFNPSGGPSIPGNIRGTVTVTTTVVVTP